MATTGRKRGRGADPEATKAQLVSAAFDVLHHDGFAAVTARSIAAQASCNQAAIYYHFGGIEPLLLTALDESSLRRLDRYRETFTGTVQLRDMPAMLQQLYSEDRSSGHLAVLTELAGGIASNPGLRQGIEDATQPWLEFVEAQIVSAASQVSFGQLIPAKDVADLVFSVVLGLEMRNKIDGREDRSDRLFVLASLVAQMLPAVTLAQK